jgi:hypothetical protein
VYKRFDATATSTGADVNTRILSGLPLGIPVRFLLRVNDDAKNTGTYGSTYEIWANGTLLDNGQFRFSGSASSRFIVFDVAAHEFPIEYDDVKLTVTGGDSIVSIYHKPVLSVSDLHLQNSTNSSARLFWTVQPSLTVTPELSQNGNDWLPVTNSSGTPMSITTPHGSMQWLDLPMPQAAREVFVRLKRQ